ncbi:hypothetical protein JMJ58_03765 [Haloterrigena salifodinae]|uniref:Uncharacterized protein n=1 Tax=Haloterrigena salifodinae TaxID=2675099 RepID=A0A8T8E3C9_9EURY|nr:hypothetical protein [Haloterrigena salifodinae]QRV16026.1 hypothetical protein JMJ58_03765 [Haloterrigena salifodinae]
MSSKNQAETDSIAKAFFRPHNIAVYGGQGTGKTNTVAHLAHYYAKFWDATILTPMKSMCRIDYAVHTPSYTDLTDWVRDHPDENFIFVYPECTDIESRPHFMKGVIDFIEENDGMCIIDYLHKPRHTPSKFDYYVKVQSIGDGLVHRLHEDPEQGEPITIPLADIKYDYSEIVEFRIYKR